MIHVQNIFFKEFFLAINYQKKMKNFPCCFVINTEPSYKPGAHWLAFYFETDRFCHFFDSFGRQPSYFGLEKYLEKTSNYFCFNKIRYQDFNSETCGYFCFIFLILKCEKINFEKIFFEGNGTKNLDKKNFNIFL